MDETTSVLFGLDDHRVVDVVRVGARVGRRHGPTGQAARCPGSAAQAWRSSAVGTANLSEVPAPRRPTQCSARQAHDVLPWGRASEATRVPERQDRGNGIGRASDAGRLRVLGSTSAHSAGLSTAGVAHAWHPGARTDLAGACPTVAESGARQGFKRSWQTDRACRTCPSVGCAMLLLAGNSKLTDVMGHFPREVGSPLAYSR